MNGALGAVILYTMNGRQYMRSKPGPRPRRKKLSPAREAAAGVFGLVSACGTDMVNAVRNRFLYPFRVATYNTIRGWMRNQYAFYHPLPEWKLVMKGADMCQLNPEAHLAAHLRTGLSVADLGGGKIELRIDAIDPKRDLKAPQGTTAVQIRVVVTANAFERDRYQTVIAEQTHRFAYAATAVPPKTIQLDSGGKAGDMAVVWLGLEYCQGAPVSADYSRELRHLPLAIVAIGRLEG
jgi:hypothetical protein